MRFLRKLTFFRNLREKLNFRNIPYLYFAIAEGKQGKMRKLSFLRNFRNFRNFRKKVKKLEFPINLSLWNKIPKLRKIGNS